MKKIKCGVCGQKVEAHDFGYHVLCHLWEDQDDEEEGREMKHTKGPWVVSKKTYKGLFISVETKENNACVGFSVKVADAHLIAAAPELLEAAKGAVAALSQAKTFKVDIETAKTFLLRAIAKAEGRSGE